MKLIKRDNVTPLHSSVEAREHKYLKHLASAMSHYLENPHGTELICILGSGYRGVIGTSLKPGSPITAIMFSKSAWKGAVRWTT